jgi:hypothetical protein
MPVPLFQRTASSRINKDGTVRLEAAEQRRRSVVKSRSLARLCCRTTTAASLVATLFFCGCAGYQIGNRSLYPTEIRTVHVPMFKSTSFRRNLGERLTEAVIKEIEAKTPYKVVNDATTADSVLSGEIIQEGKTVLIPALSGDAREVEAAMTVRVSWADRWQRRLRDDKLVPLPAEVAEVTGTGDIVAEVGQTVATAQQQAICRMAEQIVGLMEKRW